MTTSKSVRSTPVEYNRLPERSRVIVFGSAYHSEDRSLSSCFEIFCECTDFVRSSCCVLCGTPASNAVPGVVIVSLSVDRGYFVDQVHGFFVEKYNFEKIHQDVLVRLRDVG